MCNETVQAKTPSTNAIMSVASMWEKLENPSDGVPNYVQATLSAMPFSGSVGCLQHMLVGGTGFLRTSCQPIRMMGQGGPAPLYMRGIAATGNPMAHGHGDSSNGSSDTMIQAWRGILKNKPNRLDATWGSGEMGSSPV